MRAAQCHIGLIEFVLGTRLTVAQKDTFLEAIKTECATMSKQDKNNFLSACELVDSMQSMDQNGLNAVKAILQKDFEESAASLPDDPAAVLYLKIKKENSQPAIRVDDQLISSQSIAALVEYLEFVNDPYSDTSFGPDAIEKIKQSIKMNYNKLSEPEKAVLDDFQLTWYMIRAGWQKTNNQVLKHSWQNAFKAVNLQAPVAPEFTKIKACLDADLYGQMLDKAAKSGVQPGEWVSGGALEIW
jgi:hypothetical protein